MATVTFLYRSTKISANLTVRFLHRIDRAERKDLVLSGKSKIHVTKEYWDNYHKSSRIRDAETRKLQMEVSTAMGQLEMHILRVFHASPSGPFDKSWLQEAIDQFYNPVGKTSVPKDLVGLIDYYIEERKHEVGTATLRKFRLIRKKMERMTNHRQRMIVVSEINDSFKKEFVQYYEQEEYSINTASKELSIIKSICKYGQKKGLQVHPELFDLKIKKSSVKPIYLSIPELDKIRKVSLDKNHLEIARDWLVISCYSGQRISDFMTFNREMIREETGKKLIEFRQKKTQKLMTIPLHPIVEEVLEKRSGNFPPRQADQKYNNYIKEVCRLAGIDSKVEGKKIANVKGKRTKNSLRRKAGVYPKHELISSHIGRRSFASNHYGTIPTSYLIYMTGHSSEATFLEYIGKSNKDIALELIKYF